MRISDWSSDVCSSDLGHTSEAGYCLLTSAVRDGRRLISAVIGTKSWAAREQSSLELLNYGFRFFDTTSLFGPGKPAQNARVYKGKLDSIAVGTLEPVALALPRGSADKQIGREPRMN